MLTPSPSQCVLPSPSDLPRKLCVQGALRPPFSCLPIPAPPPPETAHPHVVVKLDLPTLTQATSFGRGVSCKSKSPSWSWLGRQPLRRQHFGALAFSREDVWSSTGSSGRGVVHRLSSPDFRGLIETLVVEWVAPFAGVAEGLRNRTIPHLGPPMVL